jgi:hypothetical protein
VTSAIRLVVSDVDGTLVTSDKVLTEATIAAVDRLAAAGIGFAITSGRPPMGMAMLVAPLRVTTPIGGFNGGLLVDPAMRVLAEHRIPDDLVAPIIETLAAHGLEVWLYQGVDWLVLDRAGAHVDREAFTVQFDPTVVDSYDGNTKGVVKVVGVSDDAAAIASATMAMREGFGDRVSAATSQPYYLDVTHPEANKGSVVRYLSRTLEIPCEQIATVGDSANDVRMFAIAGLSIAMGNADGGVQGAARLVTASNDDDGFALAVDRFILGL